ncbi:uncharacterized protein LY89DRAFT_747336 [Mollisia scopiformis]|uniref:ABA 3 protein n=1 Tax=Mollisia scopiformis TaxID=149040 RepID=A0A194XD21_MOLSC|nr:uncharacterized protein LY89DRAFT_747336 [Mollisia scopiformis]KUJ17652.1 hypothetical protein LY89DRAFT_747336 [Mollisia scopiformis]
MTFETADSTQRTNLDYAVQPPTSQNTSTTEPERLAAPSTNGASSHDIWFFPKEIKNDLKDTEVPEAFIAEALACAWEYARCVIPHFTNWPRYVAFTRILVVAIVVEFRGSLVDVVAGDKVLGYDVEELIDTLFAGTVGRDAMAREFRSWLLITGDKTSHRRTSELFHRYVESLAFTPRDWFRLRDCDALARLTIAAAWACNDLDDMWLSEDEFEILTELCDTLYDSVAFMKHRAEGETHNTFAYAGEELRTESFRRCREVLWALDLAWARSDGHRCVISFLRAIGGPIHMNMRRYRFVEEDLTIGRPETEQVVRETRENYKLWNRVDMINNLENNLTDHARYKVALARSNTLMFPGLAEMLQRSTDGRCDKCHYRLSYGAETAGRFGGVELCNVCRERWKVYLEDFPSRAARIFPVLLTHWPSSIEPVHEEQTLNCEEVRLSV